MLSFLKETPPMKKEKKEEGDRNEVPSVEGIVVGIDMEATPIEVPPSAGKKVVKPGVGADPTKPPCRKSKDVRREKVERKVSSQAAKEGGAIGGATPKNEATPIALPKAPPNVSKQLEDYLAEIASLSGPAHRLTVRLVRSAPPSPEFKATLEASHEVYKKYQMAIHGDTPQKCRMEQYRRFLVDSPLHPQDSPLGWDCGYGSYHQQYFIDDRLVMVGVLDILTNCVSSKYLYYDPQYGSLRLGVFSALNELALVRRLHSVNPQLRYYCMGYYVHNCPKMNYKGSYEPSYLLCPLTNNYVPISECKPKLDTRKYVRLSEGEGAEKGEELNVDDALVLYRHDVMPFGVLKALGEGKDHEGTVSEYARLVGPKVSKESLLFLA